MKIHRVLVIDGDSSAATRLAGFLTSRDYEVATSDGLDASELVCAHWRPHVMVIAPPLGSCAHVALEEARRRYPRQPIVLLTSAEGLELLLDLEAFAPALPASPGRGLSHIASVVEAAFAAA